MELPMGSGSPLPEPISQPLNGGLTRLNLTPAEPGPQSSLVDAITLVARAVTARISYLQAEIDGLRRALRPFQDLGRSQPAAGAADDAVDQLLAIARTLGEKP